MKTVKCLVQVGTTIAGIESVTGAQFDDATEASAFATATAMSAGIMYPGATRVWIMIHAFLPSVRKLGPVEIMTFGWAETGVPAVLS